MFVRGQLTRQNGADPRTLTLAVLDLETTGFEPGCGHRVCEAAVVRMRGDGEVLDEFSTLVNPERSIPDDGDLPHEIVKADVKDAPTFAQVAGDVQVSRNGPGELIIL